MLIRIAATVCRDFALFTAAPMEDLLSDHGPAFIDRVEERAAADPKFNHMLGGVLVSLHRFWIQFNHE